MSYSINKTFIVQPSESGDPSFTACTGVYSNAFLSCSGNTSILLDNNVISLIGDVFTNNNITGNTITATNYYSGVTELIDIIDSKSITGGTYNGQTLAIDLKNGSQITITGFTDVFVTGGTYNNGTVIFTNNTGGTFNVVDLFTGNTDVFVTGGTYYTNTGIATFVNNTGGTFTLSGFSTSTQFTGGTVTGETNFTSNVTANTLTSNNYFSGNTNLSNIINNIASQYSADTSVFLNISGGTVTGSTIFTNGLSANTISATTYLNLPKDIFVTGGTYNLDNGIATFINNTGGTFTVNGFKFTGGTVTGSTIFTNGLSANTMSATTYLGLPKDIFTTGATYSNNIYTFTNNTGGTFNVLFNTVTGLTVNGLLSATTINTDYIDFNTGATIPSNVSGRVYYDNQTNALSYYSDLNQDVKVDIGKQLYTIGFNNTGSLIPKGTVLSIVNSTNGIPNFIPSIINHNGFSQIIGLAASDIPINEKGLALYQGILSGLTINTFNIGDILYASPFSAGTYVSSTTNFPFTARTNQVGFVISTGITTGKIYVNIQNEDETLTLTNIERNILESNVISTGIYEYSGATTASSTTINVAPMKGWIVKNTYANSTLPDVINIFYTGGTNISITNINTADSTYLLINSGSTLYQQTTFPTPQERRENIFLGKINHPNRSSILNINQLVDYDLSPMSSLRDLWSPIKLINQGIIPTPNGANLSFNTSAGVIWGNGINWVQNQLNPNSVNISGKTPASFFYRTQTGGTSPSVTVIDPKKYDIGGVLTTITPLGSNDATNQRIYMYPTGVINVLYGQTRYNTLAEAVANIQSETFIPYPNAESTGILIGVLSVRNDIVIDGEYLNNPNYAKFTLVSKFGESFGGTGGLSTTTLQQAYDNSTTPEIVINSVLDGLTIKNGTSNPDTTTHLLEGKNTAGSTTSFITADGCFSGSSVSATTYYGLPTDIRTTGGTYSNNTFTFTNNTGGTYGVLFNTVTGLTATTLSAVTYQNLPKDVFVTGGTYSNGNILFTNNTGGTFNVTGLFTGNTDVFVTGGTYSAGTAVLTNNTGGTFSVSGFSTSTGGADTFITGGTYANGITTFINNTGGTFTISGYQNGLAYSGESFLIVTVGSSQVTNGNNLKAAYTYATTRTPYGGALSNSNRYSIILQPGVYDIGSTTFTLSNNFIDLIGLSSDPNLAIIYSSGATVVTIGSITNYRLKNLTIENDSNNVAIFCIGGVNTTTRSIEEWDNIVFKYGLNASNNTRIHDNNFTFSGRYSKIRLLTLAVGVGSTYPSEHLIMNLFSVTGTIASGTLSGIFNDIDLVCFFPNSTNIFFCIAYNIFNAQTLSGTFTNINYNTFTQIGAASPVFAAQLEIGGVSTSITGVFNNINIVTRHSNYPTLNVFGRALSTVSGTFRNITIDNINGTTNCFGGAAEPLNNISSGYFEDIRCFSRTTYFATNTASGTFINCNMVSSSQPNRSFGGTLNGIASGEFINCLALVTGAGNNQSFGGSDGVSNTASGRFINCVARSNSGGITSFGGSSHGNASGVFINCEATTISGGEQRTFGGSTANGFSGTGLKINKTGQWTARVSGYVRDSDFIALGANQSGISQIQNNAKLMNVRAISTGSGLSLNSTTTVSASTYLCAFNTTPFSGITNLITTPYNVIDINI
jgi:hypothetical protein